MRRRRLRSGDDGLLVDIKTAAAANYKRYSNDLPAKYIAQLAVYGQGLVREYRQGLNCCVLMYNKDNSELQVIVPKATDLDKALQRAHVIVDIVTELIHLHDGGANLTECVDFITDNVQYMELCAEVFQGEPTGNLLVPPDLQYNPWLVPLLYETHTTPNQRKKLTTYITRELETEEIVSKLQELTGP